LSNLLEETKSSIAQSGHTIDDIIFIGSEESGHQCIWPEFELMANKTYNSGFGGQVVCKDLIIVFKDSVKMWREEYDGSEWWNYSIPFKKPDSKFAIQSLFSVGCGWENLSEANLPSEEKEASQ